MSKPDQQMSAAELAAECKRLERELCDVERRHCIGKASVFGIRQARTELYAAIDALQAAASQREESRTREVATLTKWRDLIDNGRTFEVSDEIREILRAEKERALTAPATSIKAQAGEAETWIRCRVCGTPDTLEHARHEEQGGRPWPTPSAMKEDDSHE